MMGILQGSEWAAISPCAITPVVVQMITQANHRRRSFDGSWQRLLLILLVVLALGILPSTSEAGIITSMSADDVATSAGGGNTNPSGHHDSPLLTLLMKQQLGVLELPQSSTGTTSSTSTSNVSGHSSFVTVANAVVLGDLSCSGWIVPEAVQALLPLLPSGLFRPPCV